MNSDRAVYWNTSTMSQYCGQNSEPNQVLHKGFRNIPHRFRDNQRISVNISKIYVHVYILMTFDPLNTDLDSSTGIFADIYPRKLEFDSTRNFAF